MRRRRFILTLPCLAPFLLTVLTWLACTHHDRLQDEAAVFIVKNNIPVAKKWALTRTVESTVRMTIDELAKIDMGGRIDPDQPLLPEAFTYPDVQSILAPMNAPSEPMP